MTSGSGPRTGQEQERVRAWAFVEQMASGPQDLSTPVLPSNLARELLATRADLIQAYEMKVEDFARETRRATLLVEALEREHQALTELWERHEALRQERLDAR